MNSAENWEPFMTRNEAVKMAKELYQNRVPQAEIAKKLAAAGYLSTRTGGPIAASSVCEMLKQRKLQKKTCSSPARRRRQDATGNISAIKSILKIKGMAAEEKIALALLVLE